MISNQLSQLLLNHHLLHVLQLQRVNLLLLQQKIVTKRVIKSQLLGLVKVR